MFKLQRSTRAKARECYIEAKGNPSLARRLYVKKYGSLIVIIQVLYILWQLWQLWNSLQVADPGDEPLSQESSIVSYY